MITKILEIRDQGTFIPAVAVQMYPHEDEHGFQRYLLRRVGYECDDPTRAQVVLFRASGDGAAFSDPYAWSNRTMQTAHLYILEHFHRLSDGEVVDVQFILGETAAPKQSERLGWPL